MTQLLENFWPISMQDRENYKMHLAVYNWVETPPPYNARHEPLEAYVNSVDEWKVWQEYRPPSGINVSNEKYIFSLMDFYHDGSKKIWIFGGIYEVKSRPAGKSYTVELTNQGEDLIGRLVVRANFKFRNSRLRMENQYHKFEVLGILNQRYHGQTTLQFP